MDFCFNYEHSSSRQAFRLEHPALQINADNEQMQHNVKNISVTGIAFYGVYEGFGFGDTLMLNINFREKTIFAQVNAEILYIDEENNLTACAFKDLSSAHLSKLDLLMLQLQKYEIKKQKQLVSLPYKAQ